MTSQRTVRNPWLYASAPKNVAGFRLPRLSSVNANDPFFPSVSLLLQPTTESNGSTVFTDLSRYSHIITTVGSTQIDTGTTIFGGSTIKNATSGQYIYAGSSTGGVSAFQFPGDLTIELNFVISALPSGSQYSLFDGCNLNGDGARPNTLQVNISTTGKVRIWNSGGHILTSTNSVSTGSVQSIMVKRSGSTISCVINGTTDPTTATNSTNFSIGAAVFGTIGNVPGLSGWGMDGNYTCRITKGIARATYTPVSAWPRY